MCQLHRLKRRNSGLGVNNNQLWPKKEPGKEPIADLHWHPILFCSESWHIAGQMICLPGFFIVLYTSQELFLYDCNRAVKITACGGGWSHTSRLRAALLLQHLLPVNGWRTRPNEGDTGCEFRTWLSAHLAHLPSRAMASGLSSLFHCKPSPKEGLLCPMTCRPSSAPSSLTVLHPALPVQHFWSKHTVQATHGAQWQEQPADDSGFCQILFCSLTGQWGWRWDKIQSLSTAKWLMIMLWNISQGGIVLGLPGNDTLEGGSILVLG